MEKAARDTIHTYAGFDEQSNILFEGKTEYDTNTDGGRSIGFESKKYYKNARLTEVAFCLASEDHNRYEIKYK